MTVTFTGSATRIPACFLYNSRVSKVEFESPVRSIGAQAFYCCDALEEITLPASVRSLGTLAFSGCVNLSSVTIEGDLDDCDEASWVFLNAGTDANSLTVIFGDNVTRVPGYLFYTPAQTISDAYAHVTRVVISKSVLAVRNYAFGNCYDLYSVSFQGNAPTIRGGAFSNVTATASYPAGNATWTSDVMQGYGGSLTWRAGYPPEITAQPKAAFAKAGGAAVFTVAATGEPLMYQWYYQAPGSAEWLRVPSGTRATLSVTAAKEINGQKYFCRVSNGVGSKDSDVVTLTIVVKPKITTQPKAVSVKAGKTATFKLKASGGGLSYQWYYQKPGSSKWVKVSKATKATYSFKAAKNKNGYKYRCVVKNAAGKVTSKAVKLTVK